ncbi:hypothetical protein B484DRAFT_458374, partial [Ochromonadaceae sp. CCMP2298]
MGIAASVERVPIKHTSKFRLKYRFDLAEESTLTDCFLARASWYRIQSQKVIPIPGIGGESLSVFLSSAKILYPFYKRLLSTYLLNSTLLRKSANFQSLFLEDLCSILLAGVTSFDAVGHFYNQYKSIPIPEFGVIGVTLIETLVDELPMTEHTSIKHTTATGDLTTLVADDEMPSGRSTDQAHITRSTSDHASTTTEEEEGGWRSYEPSQDSSQSMVAAWIKLYGKFLRHIRAVEIGHPQPGAHPS